MSKASSQTIIKYFFFYTVIQNIVIQTWVNTTVRLFKKKTGAAAAAPELRAMRAPRAARVRALKRQQGAVLSLGEHEGGGARVFIDWEAPDSNFLPLVLTNSAVSLTSFIQRTLLCLITLHNARSECFRRTSENAIPGFGLVVSLPAYILHRCFATF